MWFECSNLTKVLDGYTLKDISFGLEPGTVLGLIGVNGSGKTTLIRCLLGSYHPDQAKGDGGEISLDGSHYINDMKAYRKKLGYVLQTQPYSEFMHALQVGEMYGHFYDGFDLKKYKDLVKKYEIPEKKLISEFSSGQQIRLQFAFMQSYEAKLYIMDEPVGNLDVGFRDSVYELIRELTSKEEKAVILSSHLVTELERISYTLLWLKKENNTGSVRFLGSCDELKEQYRLLSTDLSYDKLRTAGISSEMIAGFRIRESHKEYLIRCSENDMNIVPAKMIGDARYADLSEIMYYTEKGEENA